MMIRIVFIFVVVLFSTPIFAQNNDAAIWASAVVKKDLNYQWNLAYEQCFRLGNNVSEMSEYYSDLAVEFSPSKYLGVAAFYRMSRANQGNCYDYSHRMGLDLSTEYSLYKFTLKYRTRLQRTYSQYYSSDDGQSPRDYWRNKFTLQYKIRKTPLTPFVAFESYLPVNYYKRDVVDKLRYSGGLNYKINYRSKCSAFFMLQEEINRKNPTSTYVYGLEYAISL